MLTAVLAGWAVPSASAQSTPAAAAKLTGSTSAAPRTWWKPPITIDWQWEIDHPLSTTSPTDMGRGQHTYLGTLAPTPTAYDIDGMDNSAATVARLHALHDRAICYIEVGSAGDYEGAYATYFNEFEAAGDLGESLAGYPSEQFLNINSASTVTIVKSIIYQQCSKKGFDAVETDLDETFNGNEGATGFTITQADEETYLETLAAFMHRLGMAWIAKNLDDTGNQGFVDDMMNVADGTITEQCNQYATCSYLQPFEGHKAIFDAEYGGSPSTFCPADNAAEINGDKFDTALDGRRIPCH